jgi:NapC/NirT cytochrome c family protein/cytochrome c
MKLRERLTKFFFPGPNASRWMLIMPYVVLGILFVALLSGGVYGWEYTNSPKFCGTACHTMPPQDVTYKLSPHVNVTCEECHVGRASFGSQLMRKTQNVKETYDYAFTLYKYPIFAEALRPPRDTCEKCHQPEAFLGDSLRTINHFADDSDNSKTSTYLILKTGGGAKRDGQGLGIHWHIVNKVEYYATDALAQDIPYVRVTNDDGATTEYTDVNANVDISKIDKSQIKTMDCVTCHNRVTHNFEVPAQSVDEALSKGLLDPTLPNIHEKAVEVLSAKYASRDEAVAAIQGIDAYYKGREHYSENADKIKAAIKEIQTIYDSTVFHDQKVDWTTHPNNLGHINSPGCFRCHDGKHLDANQKAIRLECNLCHSVPVVAKSQDFVTKIEISRGPEPETHRNPNWISLHNQAIGASCAACHTMDDPGGTSNTSFCSNSACHGTAFKYAGFDAPQLRDILKSQLPPPEPAPTLAVPATPTFENYIGALFAAKCTICHGPAATGGLTLTSFADTMKGGKDGAIIVPGDSANSLLITVQSKQHFANLTADELAIVKQWIDAGAPEK